MKLVAAMIVRDEAGRYLGPCLEHLLGFVDEIRILDDGSTDEFADIDWSPADGVQILRKSHSTFYEHEGRARQELLDWTAEAKPTHVLAIDADEFLADGLALRDAMASPGPEIWRLNMQEVWAAEDDRLLLRQDGGWKEHPVPIAYWWPPDNWTNRQVRRHWHIPDRALASGRVPAWINHMGNRTAGASPTDILHFGWTNVADRQERYDRYVVHDGGRHHASSHLESIMWDDNRISMSSREWPPGLVSVKPRLVERASRG